MSRHTQTCRRPIAAGERLSDAALAVALGDLARDGRIYVSTRQHAMQVQLAARVAASVEPMAMGAGWVVERGGVE